MKPCRSLFLRCMLFFPDDLLGQNRRNEENNRDDTIKLNACIPWRRLYHIEIGVSFEIINYEQSMAQKNSDRGTNHNI